MTQSADGAAVVAVLAEVRGVAIRLQVSEKEKNYGDADVFSTCADCQ